MENDDEEKHDEIINNLMKEGKYDEILKFINAKGDDDVFNLSKENDEDLKIIPADDISDLQEDDNKNIVNQQKENKEDIKLEDNIKEEIDIPEEIIEKKINRIPSQSEADISADKDNINHIDWEY